MRQQVQGKSRYGLPWIEPQHVGRPRWIHKNPLQAGQGEEYYEPLRDVLITPPGAALVPQGAFSIPINGSYTPPTGTAYQKTRWDTNLKLAGQLPNPNIFQVEGMAVNFHPNTHPLDAAVWAAQMLVTFSIGDSDKKYVECQPMFIGGAGGLHSSGTTVGTASPAAAGYILTSNGWPVVKNLHVLGDDLSSGAQIIEQGQTFGVTEDPTQDKYDAAYTTVAVTSTLIPLGKGIVAHYLLIGHWLRGVQ